MSIGAVVVLYNPDNDVMDNIHTYLPIVDYLVAVDNSTHASRIVKELASDKKSEIIEMGGNKGIATALNAGCSRLVELGCDIALTMDQDSRFPLEQSESILSEVQHLIKEYAIVGLNYNNMPHGVDDISVPKYWLTSGNFLSLGAYEKVGGFNDELFIDYVDIEFNHRLRKAGMNICYLNNFSLQHKIGNPISIHIFGRTYYAMNESPVRCYYRYRNSRYLYKTDKQFYWRKFWSEILLNIPKILLFEPEKKEKMRMVCRGLRDGGLGVLGPLKEEV